MLGVKVCENLWIRSIVWSQLTMSYGTCRAKGHNWEKIYRENRGWFVLIELLLCASGQKISGRVMEQTVLL